MSKRDEIANYHGNLTYPAVVIFHDMATTVLGSYEEGHE